MKENEVVMLLLSLCVLVFIILYIKLIIKIRHWQFLLGAYLFLVVASISTNLESYFFPDVYNMIEHISYAISGLLILIWILLLNKKEIKN
jgi:hypothetical protein